MTPASLPATTHGMAEDLTALSFEDALKMQCERRLKDAQARIEKISFGSDGAPTGTTPFDGS